MKSKKINGIKYAFNNSIKWGNTASIRSDGQFKTKDRSKENISNIVNNFLDKNPELSRRLQLSKTEYPGNNLDLFKNNIYNSFNESKKEISLKDVIIRESAKTVWSRENEMEEMIRGRTEEDRFNEIKIGEGRGKVRKISTIFGDTWILTSEETGDDRETIKTYLSKDNRAKLTVIERPSPYMRRTTIQLVDTDDVIYEEKADPFSNNITTNLSSAWPLLPKSKNKNLVYQ